MASSNYPGQDVTEVELPLDLPEVEDVDAGDEPIAALFDMAPAPKPAAAPRLTRRMRDVHEELVGYGATGMHRMNWSGATLNALRRASLVEDVPGEPGFVRAKQSHTSGRNAMESHDKEYEAAGGYGTCADASRRGDDEKTFDVENAAGEGRDVDQEAAAELAAERGVSVEEILAERWPHSSRGDRAAELAGGAPFPGPFYPTTAETDTVCDAPASDRGTADGMTPPMIAGGAGDELPPGLAKVLARLRDDAHNETGSLGMYARDLLALAGDRRAAIPHPDDVGGWSNGRAEAVEVGDVLIGYQYDGSACREIPEKPIVAAVKHEGRYVRMYLDREIASAEPRDGKIQSVWLPFDTRVRVYPAP